MDIVRDLENQMTKGDTNKKTPPSPTSPADANAPPSDEGDEEKQWGNDF